MRRAVLAAVTLAWVASDSRGATGRWLELKTAHFRLLSDASPSKTVEIATLLEAFRATVARSTQGLAIPSDDVATIFVFRSDASFDPYKDRPDRGGNRELGFCASTPERELIALNATPQQDISLARQFDQFQFSYGAVFHEYTHALLHRTFAGLPVWLDEGIATYFSTFWVHGRTCDVGHADRRRLARMRAGLPIPLEDFVRIPSFERMAPEKEESGYDEAWAVVHTLLRGPDDRRKQFSSFLSLLLQGTSQERAFATAFPVSLGTLQGEVEAHVRRNEFSLPSYTLDDLRVRIDEQPSPASPAEIDDELGDLVALVREDRLEVAESHYRSALALRADDARALAGLGLVEEKRGHAEAAEAAYRRALAASPDDAVVNYRLGRFLALGVDAVAGPDPPAAPLPPRLVEARARLTSALMARPDLTSAQILYGMTYLFDPGDRTSGIAALEAARNSRPEAWEIVDALGRLRVWAGDLFGAAALLDSPAAVRGDPGEVEGFRELVVDALQRHAQEIIGRQGKAAGAAWLRSAIETIDDGSILAQLRRWLAAVEGAKPAGS